MEMYNEFAKVYDKLMEEVPYDKWFEYIEKIFMEYNIEPKMILEMACGSGNMTQYFCKNRYKVTAFDLSEEMLLLAQEKIGRKPNLKLSCQNMTEFKYREKFDVVLAVCDSLNYLIEDGDLEKTFKNVYDHLNESGLFIFDINSIYKFENILGKNKFVTEEDECFLVWENEYEKPICQLILNFFIEDEDGRYERYEEVHKERAYTTEFVETLLKKVGFSSVDSYEAFTLNTIQDENERINFVVKK